MNRRRKDAGALELDEIVPIGQLSTNEIDEIAKLFAKLIFDQLQSNNTKFTNEKKCLIESVCKE